MIQVLPKLPEPTFQWVENGKPTPDFYNWMFRLDTVLRALTTAINTGAVANVVAFADLPTSDEGALYYVTNGRKNGEGAGLGTGNLAFHDGSTWIAVDTGTALAA